MHFKLTGQLFEVWEEGCVCVCVCVCVCMCVYVCVCVWWAAQRSELQWILVALCQPVTMSLYSDSHV